MQFPDSASNIYAAVWLAQLVERQSAVQKVKGSSPRPDQHSGSQGLVSSVGRAPVCCAKGQGF